MRSLKISQGEIPPRKTELNKLTMVSFFLVVKQAHSIYAAVQKDNQETRVLCFGSNCQMLIEK